MKQKKSTFCPPGARAHYSSTPSLLRRRPELLFQLHPFSPPSPRAPKLRVWGGALALLPRRGGGGGAIPCWPIRPLSVANPRVAARRPQPKPLRRRARKSPTRLWVGERCDWSSPTNHSFPRYQTLDRRSWGSNRSPSLPPPSWGGCSTGRALGQPVSFCRGVFYPSAHGPIVVVCSAQAVTLRRCALALRYSSSSARRRPSFGPDESWCGLPSAGKVVGLPEGTRIVFGVDLPSFRHGPLRDLASPYTPRAEKRTRTTTS